MRLLDVEDATDILDALREVRVVVVPGRLCHPHANDPNFRWAQLLWRLLWQLAASAAGRAPRVNTPAFSVPAHSVNRTAPTSCTLRPAAGALGFVLPLQTRPQRRWRKGCAAWARCCATCASGG